MKRNYFLAVLLLISFLALANSCSANQKQTRVARVKDANAVTDTAVGALSETETPETTKIVAKERKKPENVMEDLAFQQAEDQLRDTQEDITETKNSRLK